MVVVGGVVTRTEERYVCDTTTIESFVPSTRVASSGIDALPNEGVIVDFSTSGSCVGIGRSGNSAKTKDSLESALLVGCVR